MDEMKIVSKFMTSMLSKLAKRAIKKSIGTETDILIHKIDAYMDEEKAHIHLDADIDLTKEELTNLLKRVGLN